MRVQPAPFDDHLTHDPMDEFLPFMRVAPVLPADTHDAFLMDVAEALDAMTLLRDDERDEIFARIVDSLPTQYQNQIDSASGPETIAATASL